MTQNEILTHELLSFLSHVPGELQEHAHGYAGKLAVSIGNALRLISHTIEKKPDEFTPLGQQAKTLFALAMQFREAGLQLWDAEKTDKSPAVAKLNREVDQLKTRLKNLEGKTFRKLASEREVVE